MTINSNFKVFDVAQVGEDVDRTCIVNDLERRVVKASPTFHTDEIDQVRALCRVLDAAFELGRSGGAYVVDDGQMITLIREAIEAGLARKGRG